MTQEELDQGSSFVDAVRDFLAWAGGGAQFCTWGTVDLVELQRNMKYHGVLSKMKTKLTIRRPWSFFGNTISSPFTFFTG